MIIDIFMREEGLNNTDRTCKYRQIEQLMLAIPWDHKMYQERIC